MPSLQGKIRWSVERAVKLGSTRPSSQPKSSNSWRGGSELTLVEPGSGTYAGYTYALRRLFVSRQTKDEVKVILGIRGSSLVYGKSSWTPQTPDSSAGTAGVVMLEA